MEILTNHVFRQSLRHNKYTHSVQKAKRWDRHFHFHAPINLTLTSITINLINLWETLSLVFFSSNNFNDSHDRQMRFNRKIF